MRAKIITKRRPEWSQYIYIYIYVHTLYKSK